MKKLIFLGLLFLSSHSFAQTYFTWQPKTYYNTSIGSGTIRREASGPDEAGPIMAYETLSQGDTLYARIGNNQKYNVIGLSSTATLTGNVLASNTSVKYAFLHGYDVPVFLTWYENGVEGTHANIGTASYLRIRYGASIVYDTSANGTSWAVFRTSPATPTGSPYYVFAQLQTADIESEFLNVSKGAAPTGGSGGGATNTAPIVGAGADQSLAYGTTSTSVTGTATDVDGAIVSRLWTLLSGPNTPTFSAATSATTNISGLISGTYEFVFRATDDSAAYSEDNVIITVDPAPPAGGGSGSSGTTTFAPVIIPTSATDFQRPGASLEYWIYQSVINYPTATSPSDNGLDRYDRFEWRSFENGNAGTYTWTEFDNSIAAAIDKNQKFSFGVMTLCSSCTDFSTSVGGGTLTSYPLYLHTLMQAETVNSRDWIGNGVWVPNYNSPNYLDRHKALLLALADHISKTSYKGVPYKNVIRYIDVRGIGDYSEWHHYGFNGSFPTGRFPVVSTYKRVIDDYLLAFPNFQLVSLSDGYDPAGESNTPPEVVSYILNAKNNVGKLGYRRDNIGSGFQWVNTKLENNPAVWAGVNLKDSIMTRWQTAPLVGEPMGCCSIDGGGSLYFDLTRQVSYYHINSLGNGNIESPTNTSTVNAFRAAGKLLGHRYTITGGSTVGTIGTGSPFNITLNWRNDGNSPTYERWNIVFELRNPTTNAVVWSGTSAYNLKGLLPSGTATAVTGAFTVPLNVAPGTYRLHLIVRDSIGYRQPYPIAINGRQTDGSYILANTISVATGGVSAPNVAPVATAGADQTITLPINSVSLSGTGTDADGNISLYSWTKVSGPVGASIISPNTAATTITFTTAGTYVFRLSVTDNQSAVSNDDIQIIVRQTLNTPPSAFAGNDQVITLPVNATTLVATGTDTEGAVTYLWTKVSGPAGGTIANPTSASTSATGLSNPGVYVFSVAVTDLDGAITSDTVQIVVTAPVQTGSRYRLIFKAKS